MQQAAAAAVRVEPPAPTAVAVASPPVSKGSAWHLPPFFMLRVAGLPFESVEPLCAPRTVAWAAEAIELERRLRDSGPAVGDALHAAVPRAGDAKLRRRLLDLRRDVHNLRLPREGGDLGPLRQALGERDAAALGEWLALRRRHQDLLAAGEEVLAGELREGRRALRALAGDPRLRKGILLASPSLDRYLPTYLDAPEGPLGKRARRIEQSLLEYLYRTACKTSPFSTLTAVALGRFEPRTGRLLQVDRAGSPRRSHTRINLAALARLADVLVGDPRRRADLPVTVTSGWRSDSRRIRYVRRQRRGGDDDEAVTIDVLQENLFYLSSGRILEELLAAVPPGSQRRLADLAEQLWRNDPDGRARDDVEAYLGQLLRLGLLTVPLLHTDIHHPDPLGAFSDRIRRLGLPWTGDLADRLDLVGGYVDDYREAPLDRRRWLLEAIRGELAEAQHDLGRAEATTPRTVVYEDETLGEARVGGDAERWRRELQPGLEGLSRILPVFDLSLPSRLLVKGFFRARYGSGGSDDDVIRFVHEFQRDCYEQFMRMAFRRRPFDDAGRYLPQQNWFRLPEVDALDDARSELVRRMGEASAALPDGAPELVLDDDFVDGVAARLPGDLGLLEPRSFFLQLAGDERAPLGVLNRAYSGLTLLFSRFAHCFGDGDGRWLVDGLRDTLLELQPEGTVFAELTGGYDTTNLNLHPAVVPYELVCPGDVSSLPRSRQIPVDDLVIVDDPARDRLELRSRRLGVAVIPVYLGFLLPMALPEVQRVLLTFSYTNMAGLDLWGGVPRPPAADGVEAFPRVRYRNLVLARGAWKAPARALPSRAAGGPGSLQAANRDAGWFLDWQRWSRAHELPRRVFVSAIPDSAGDDGAAGGPDSLQAASRGAAPAKPQYVDFHSYLSLLLLDNLARSADAPLTLTEMLPGAGELWLGTDEGRYVTELTVELDGVRTEGR